MFALQPTFWKHFFADYWGNKPTLIRRPFTETIFSSQEIIKALPNALSRIKSDPGVERHLQIGQQALNVNEYDPWFVQTSDSSFDSYMSRIRRKLDHAGLDSLACGVSDIHIDVGRHSWNRIRGFLKGVNDEGNYPLSFASLHVFMGNNRVSFQGVHRDIYDVFCFVIDGEKRMRFWPSNYFDKPTSSKIFDYEHYKKDSIAIEAKPGDIIYWPKQYWHVGEIDSGAAISLSLLMAVGGGLSRAQNLELRTASGFFKIFSSKPLETLCENQLIQGESLLPILTERKGRKLRLSAAGLSIEIPYSSQLLWLTEELNSGKRLHVKEILTHSQDRKNFQLALDSLYSFGAFSKVDGVTL